MASLGPHQQPQQHAWATGKRRKNMTAFLTKGGGNRKEDKCNYKHHHSPPSCCPPRPPHLTPPDPASASHQDHPPSSHCGGMSGHNNYNQQTNEHVPGNVQARQRNAMQGDACAICYVAFMWAQHMKTFSLRHGRYYTKRHDSSRCTQLLWTQGSNSTGQLWMIYTSSRGGSCAGSSPVESTDYTTGVAS